MKRHRIEKIREVDLEKRIKENEEEGWKVAGLTWVECNCEYTVVFVCDSVEPQKLKKNKKKKKMNLEDFQRILEEEIKKIPPYKEPYKNPYIEPWPSKPNINEPYRNPYPWNEPWIMPQIIYCGENDNRLKKNYSNISSVTTHTYPTHWC